MTGLNALIKRNTKLFFRDKGLFFTSLITPAILLVLYAAFLAKVYRDSFTTAVPLFLEFEEDLLGGMVGGQLVSSLLAVSCVTVPFCSNMLIVQDKVNKCRGDLAVTPVKGSTLAIGYFAATLISSLIICFVAFGLGCIYLAVEGWYLTAGDILLVSADILLTVMFGTALSSVINFFLSSQGQISAVGTIVSSGYGFICGAYMPISQFSEGLQRVISFLPGTYATSLFRRHLTQGVLDTVADKGFPEEAIIEMGDVFDANLYFFGNEVGDGLKFAVVIGTVTLLLGIYIALNAYRTGKAGK